MVEMDLGLSRGGELLLFGRWGGKGEKYLGKGGSWGILMLWMEDGMLGWKLRWKLMLLWE